MVGTNRVLGVYSETEGTCQLPKEMWSPLLHAQLIYADFTVRPLTLEQPGVMRMVCVAAAANILIRPVTANAR